MNFNTCIYNFKFPFILKMNSKTKNDKNKHEIIDNIIWCKILTILALWLMLLKFIHFEYSNFSSPSN